MVIDFIKLNNVTRKDHYPLPFIDKMLERLPKHTHFFFLDGYSGFSQIPVSQPNQEKTTFTCPFGTMLIDVCLSIYVMHLLPFKDVCLLYSLTFVKRLLRFPWMTSLFMGSLFIIV